MRGARVAAVTAVNQGSGHSPPRRRRRLWGAVWCVAAITAGPAVLPDRGSDGVAWHAATLGAETAPARAEDPATREQRVLAFVAEHQPELAEVLAHLATRKPAEYAAAISDLDRGVRAVEASRAKDERLHGIELRSWQARTRVDLLVARWLAAGGDDRAALEPAIRAAVSAELDTRSEHLAYRKERSMAWYERQLVRLRDERDELVATRLKALLPAGPKKVKGGAAVRSP